MKRPGIESIINNFFRLIISYIVLEILLNAASNRKNTSLKCLILRCLMMHSKKETHIPLIIIYSYKERKQYANICVSARDSNENIVYEGFLLFVRQLYASKLNSTTHQYWARHFHLFVFRRVFLLQTSREILTNLCNCICCDTKYTRKQPMKPKQTEQQQQQQKKEVDADLVRSVSYLACLKIVSCKDMRRKIALSSLMICRFLQLLLVWKLLFLNLYRLTVQTHDLIIS